MSLYKAAIAALYFTELMSSLSPDSWQKLAPPGLIKPCRQNSGTGRLFSVTSTQCTTSPVTFPSKVWTCGRARTGTWLCTCEDQCNLQGQASCMGMLQGQAAPSHQETRRNWQENREHKDPGAHVFIMCKPGATELPCIEPKAI